MAKTGENSVPINENGASLVSKMERAEVDTTLPFESVKVAVNLFEIQAELKKPTSYQKQVTSELHLTKEQLKEALQKLASSEKEKDKALQELREAKNLLDIVSKSQEDKATVREGPIVCLRSRRNGPSITDGDNKYAIWETKLRNMEERHAISLTEMETLVQELADLKQELLASATSKEDTVFAALGAIEGKVKTVEEITAEISGINNWLSLLKIASTETTKEKCADLKAASEQFQTGKEFESKLIAMMNESIRLRADMKSVRDKEAKLIEIALDTLAILKSVNAVLCGRGDPLDVTVITAARNGKDKRDSLPPLVELMHVESKALMQGAVELKEREAKAISATNSAASDLAKVQSELASAVGAIECETLKSISGLALALKQAETESEAAKAETKKVHEEALQYRREAEARLQESLSSLAGTLREAEVEATQCKEEVKALREVQAEAAQAQEEALRKAEAEAAKAKEELKALRKVEAEAARFQEELKYLRKVEAEAANFQEELEALRMVKAEADQAKEEIKMLRKVEAEAAEVKKELETLRKIGAEAAQAKEELGKLQKTEAEAAVTKEELEALRKIEAEAVKVKEELQALRSAASNTENLASEYRDISCDLESEWISFTPSRGKLDLGITISQEEYDSLKMKAQERESYVNTMAAADLSQVECVKEMLLENIASANEEMESMKKALQQALHKAEMAEKAKCALEDELKRLREREQRRREKTMALLASQQQQQQQRFANGENSSVFPSEKHSEPLGRVLNINISAQRTKTLVRISSRKHRKPKLSSVSTNWTETA